MVAIIGGGPAGLEAASLLADNGIAVSLFEADRDWAKNLKDKYQLFPDFSMADDLLKQLSSKIEQASMSRFLNTEITHLKKEKDVWTLTDGNGNAYEASAVLLATGYKVFDARRKEEFGFGIYDGAITSIQLEDLLRTQQISTLLAEKPHQRVVFLQCVGSRDEKTGNRYCSKICCVTAVKQAIEVKKMIPKAEVFIFYMDLRMWGQRFEELYCDSQESYHIKYVRGRISEASSTFDGRIQIKAEDTLIGQPLKMTTDLLVLMVGIEPSNGTKKLGKTCGICGDYGFLQSKSVHLSDNHTDKAGLFLAGTCKRPMGINETVTDARSAALSIIKYLRDHV